MTFYFLSFNIVRQCLAVSIILFGTSFLLGDRKWLFVVFVILASFVHFSALFALSFYLIYKVDIPKRIMIVCLFVSFFIGLVGINLAFLDFSAYESYIDNFNTIEESSFSRILLRLLINCFAVYFVLRKYNYGEFLLKMFFLSICMSNIFINTHPYIARMMIYFTIFQPVYFSYLWGGGFGQKKYFFYRSIDFYLFVFVYFVYWVHYLNINSGEIVPYKFSESFL